MSSRVLAHRVASVLRLRQFASSTFSTQTLFADSETTIIKEEEDAAVDPSSKWVILPAVPRVKGIARVLGHTHLTAIKWVSRCFPEISHIAIEKLFRMRQVRLCSPEAECEQAKLKRIARKEIVTEGSILYLPRSALRRMESAERLGVTSDPDERESSLTKKVYKPTRDDIEWARELIIHMDDHIIAINKPPGLAVQGGIGVGRSLDDLLGPAFSFDYDECPKLVHRIDKETSGILVLGRTQESTAMLHEMFRAKTRSATSSGSKGSKSEDGLRSIKRKYLALVIGTPSKRKGRITAPLKKVVLDSGKSEAIVVADESSSEDALEAITDYRVLGSSLHGCTWVELQPYTGRKHQLRVHCAQFLGMPILGDYKYGRQVHESWFSKVDRADPLLEVSGEEGQNWNSKRVDLSTLMNVKGCVTSKKPLLHLHSRLLAIPKIRELRKKKPSTSRGRASKGKIAFVDSLRLLAPLPLHMKATWDLVPPTLKKDLHEQFLDKLGAKNSSVA